MASLGACRHCGQWISKRAKVCPHCGRSKPVPKSVERRIVEILLPILLAVFFLLDVLLAIRLVNLRADSRARGPSIVRPASESPSDGELERNVRHLLSDGDGRDWLRLSSREKHVLGAICAETTRRHNASCFRNFLESFYQEAQSNAGLLLDKPISEVAAVAAALELDCD